MPIEFARARKLLRLTCACALVWAFAATLRLPRAGASPVVPGKLRVLLVGNSYTRFNVMPRLLARLSGSEADTPQLVVDAEARGGSTLRRHWLQGRALTLIKSGLYTHVVLQDHSLRTVDRPEEFREYVARFKHVIDASAARTVLYSTWPRHPSARLYRQHPVVHSFEEMAARVDGTYREAALQLGAELAPVGRAFERALAEQPDLPMYRPDATHPTVPGSFLAACVLYGTITGRDPRETTYVPYELGAEQAAIVKQLAAEALADAHPPVAPPAIEQLLPAPPTLDAPEPAPSEEPAAPLPPPEPPPEAEPPPPVTEPVLASLPSLPDPESERPVGPVPESLPPEPPGSSPDSTNKPP